MRIGKHERAILLGAGVDEFLAIPAVDEIEARMQPLISRARSKLERVGLIETERTNPYTSPRTPVRRRNRYGDIDEYTMYRQQCLYRLTELGRQKARSLKRVAG